MSQLSSHAASAATLGFVIEGNGSSQILRVPPSGYLSPTNIITVPLSLDNGWPVIAAGLNGVVTTPMVFDTGAQFTSLDGRTAARAGVRTVSTNEIAESFVRGAGGRERVCVGVLDHLVLGGLEITNVGVSVHLEETVWGRRGERVSGLLGLMPVIAGMSYVTIDYPAKSLTMAPRDEYRPGGAGGRGPIQVPFVFTNGHLLATLGLPNGHRTAFVIDTGWSGELILSAGTIRNAGLEDAVRRGRQVELSGIGGISMEKAFTVDWIEVAGRRHAYIQGSTGSWTPYDLIGSGWLRRFRATFDFRRQVLWLE